MRRVVDELKRTNQEGPRRSSTQSAKRAAELGFVRLGVNSVLSGHLNWAWLTGILDPRNLFPQKFVRGRSAKILSPENLALYGIIYDYIVASQIL